jgi:VIT1/CCC1 family predicted Fe2+/Mn2+ transporter
MLPVGDPAASDWKLSCGCGQVASPRLRDCLTAALGRAGLVVGIAAAGLADSQSAAISAATLASAGHVSISGAAVAILAALTTNTFSKAVVVGVLDRPPVGGVEATLTGVASYGSLTRVSPDHRQFARIYVQNMAAEPSATVTRAPLPEAVRDDARDHIRDHARKEAARIERLSRIREFVLGAQDGLLVPLGVVTGMAAANPGRSAILVAGIAEAVAGCIAMGGGSYLASEAEEGLYAAEFADEGREIDEEPSREIAELALVLEDEGLPRDAAERVAHGLAANRTVFLRTKIQKELGLSPDVGGAALGDALTVGLTYMGAAIVPLWPYVALPLMAPALITSLVCTLVALFALGVAKGRIARQAWQRAGLQVMLIGSASAAVGFAIGHLVTALTG